ncbi:site-specific integrase [Anaerovorax sp. IOR16]|uniref:site-specific integrase n=1 Tax=Anaerovorax sp. IOR16 TaxID=2773458 RepID=UPI0019D2908B|nr:site-specific integrase [Anaerovorax sp. IOR16]
MAKAKKLPSGSWRVQVYSHTENGKRIYESFTDNEKTEAEYLASQFARNKKGKRKPSNMTVGEAIDSYISSKDGILAPDTIAEYKRSRKRDFKEIENIKLNKLDTISIQKAINDISKRISVKTKKPLSPKTVSNIYALLTAAINTYCPMQLDVTLPKKQKSRLYVPTDGDITKLIDSVKETCMEIPIILSAFGSLRRSEICALYADGIVKNTVKVRKALVQDENKNWVLKYTKSYAGDRDIVLPEFVIKKLPTEGKITELNPNMISKRFSRILKNNGIPHFRFHDLRHYYASILHALNVPDQYVMRQGGWNTNDTLKRVYQHTMSDKETKFTDVALQHFEKIQHEMQHDE